MPADCYDGGVVGTDIRKEALFAAVLAHQPPENASPETAEIYVRRIVRTAGVFATYLEGSYVHT
jgi:hypothetical protein